MISGAAESARETARGVMQATAGLAKRARESAGAAAEYP